MEAQHVTIPFGEIAQKEKTFLLMFKSFLNICKFLKKIWFEFSM
jgi:hypothetical protein